METDVGVNCTVRRRGDLTMSLLSDTLPPQTGRSPCTETCWPFSPLAWSCAEQTWLLSPPGGAVYRIACRKKTCKPSRQLVNLSRSYCTSQWLFYLPYDDQVNGCSVASSLVAVKQDKDLVIDILITAARLCSRLSVGMRLSNYRWRHWAGPALITCAGLGASFRVVPFFVFAYSFDRLETLQALVPVVWAPLLRETRVDASLGRLLRFRDLKNEPVTKRVSESAQGR